MVLDRGPGEDRPDEVPATTSKASRFNLKLIGAGVVVLAIAVLVIVVAASGGGGGSDNEASGSPSDSGGLLDEALPTPEATIDLARPTVEAPPAHLESVGPNDRMVIAKYGIDAPLAYQKVAPTGVMPDPTNPDEVVYYDFSALSGFGGAPGRGGNVVMSGHVDSGKKPCKNGTVPPPCQAVFWDVRTMRTGDEIEIHVGGQMFRYRVTGSQAVHAVSGPWDQIVASTAQETLTLITCGGEFVAGEYTHRTVVTATRV
jgi:LPXTG-site transpeptidase (sortase) family protein